jgi:hypothetical protein
MRELNALRTLYNELLETRFSLVEMEIRIRMREISFKMNL